MEKERKVASKIVKEGCGTKEAPIVMDNAI